MRATGDLDLATGLPASKSSKATAKHGPVAARGTAKPVPGRKEWSG